MAKHILIIEDDNDFKVYLSKLLIKNGYSVDSASNGAEAMDLIDKKIPVMIITDIVMPEMDGLEVIRQMKKKIPLIKIIAISGGGRLDPDLYLDMASNLNADFILEKPFQNDVLLEKIGSLLSDI